LNLTAASAQNGLIYFFQPPFTRDFARFVTHIFVIFEDFGFMILPRCNPTDKLAGGPAVRVIAFGFRYDGQLWQVKQFSLGTKPVLMGFQFHQWITFIHDSEFRSCDLVERDGVPFIAVSLPVFFRIFPFPAKVPCLFPNRIIDLLYIRFDLFT